MTHLLSTVASKEKCGHAVTEKQPAVSSICGRNDAGDRLPSVASVLLNTSDSDE